VSDLDENASVRGAADAVVEYESEWESCIKDHPLTAVAISLVVGALLAKFLF
jgi:hypothetical protein